MRNLCNFAFAVEKFISIVYNKKWVFSLEREHKIFLLRPYAFNTIVGSVAVNTLENALLVV